MTPFELIPPIKDYIWGGTKLREEFGKESSLERLAESWELSCHKDGMSVIGSGEFSGTTLAELIKDRPEIVGGGRTELPVLVKLIDARNDLSIQVHPDDAYAQAHEGDNGKTEMWYIVDCEPGAELVYGFSRDITKEEFRRAIEEDTLMGCVDRVPVKKGDVFFITPGTLHAIGKGILIAEIQQSSNVTYRVYDYGRLGADGKPRELHIEKAVEVTNTRRSAPYAPAEPVALGTSLLTVLAKCRYFTASKAEIRGEMSLGELTEESFVHILCIDGEGELTFEGGSIGLKKGSSVFVPAGTKACYIKGKCCVIATSL
ncbi:MAG: mannose-6-phosphate isomerase, class I [Ruminococcus sp.]|nr:mannose-6-phosphate isomerase, class I [Ruminococcus sp.]